MNILSFITTSKYWLIAMLVAFVAGAGIGWHEKSLRVPALLEAQKEADEEACNTAKEITRKANEQLQNDRDRIASDLAKYKRMHPTSCVIPSKRPNTGSGGTEYAGGNGAVAGTSDDFREYAATCETYRSEVIACINFLDAERKPQ